MELNIDVTNNQRQDNLELWLGWGPPAVTRGRCGDHCVTITVTRAADKGQDKGRPLAARVLPPAAFCIARLSVALHCSG